MKPPVLDHNHATHPSSHTQNEPARYCPPGTDRQARPGEQKSHKDHWKGNLTVHPGSGEEKLEKEQAAEIGLAGEISRQGIGNKRQEERCQNQPAREHPFGNTLSHAPHPLLQLPEQSPATTPSAKSEKRVARRWLPSSHKAPVDWQGVAWRQPATTHLSA